MYLQFGGKVCGRLIFVGLHPQNVAQRFPPLHVFYVYTTTKKGMWCSLINPRHACAARVTVVVVCVCLSVCYPTSHFTSHESLHKGHVVLLN